MLAINLQQFRHACEFALPAEKIKLAEGRFETAVRMLQKFTSDNYLLSNINGSQIWTAINRRKLATIAGNILLAIPF